MKYFTRPTLTAPFYILIALISSCATTPTYEALDLAPRIQNDRLQSYLEFIANELHKVSSEEIFVSAYETPILSLIHI